MTTPFWLFGGLSETDVKAQYILPSTLRGPRDGLITLPTALGPPCGIGKCRLEGNNFKSCLFLSIFQSQTISAQPGAKTTKLGAAARMEAGSWPAGLPRGLLTRLGAAGKDAPGTSRDSGLVDNSSGLRGAPRLRPPPQVGRPLEPILLKPGAEGGACARK